MFAFVLSWLASIPTFSLPYALAALGLIISERAGVLNLAAEGLMLVGALSAVGSILSFGVDPSGSLVAAAGAAAIVSLIFAVLTILLRVNQVIVGLAMVFFCQGLTSLLGEQLNWSNRVVSALPRPYLGWLGELPIVGRILTEQDVLMFAAVPLVACVFHVLFKTNIGLRLRSVGENPEAADAMGVGVLSTRFGAVVVGSALLGLAGAYISVGSARIWVDDMTSGRGWIAIALVIFSRWRPWRALGGALLFGGIEALIPKLAASGVRLPQYLVMMTPYLATLVVMIWMAAAKRNSPPDEPGALGRPYVREERR